MSWNWRPTAFFDMDGVIADWATAVAELFGVDPLLVRACEKSSGDDDLLKAVGMSSKSQFWRTIASAGPGFWYNIPGLEDGMRCLRKMQATEGLDVCILTKPTFDAACYNGKAMWVQSRLGKNTESLTLCREKWRLSGPNTLLIDDDPRNTDMFSAGHGRGLLIPRPYDDVAAQERADVFEQALQWAQETVRSFNG